MFSNLQKKMVCFPIVLDRIMWEGKNKQDLQEELQSLLSHASKPNKETYHDFTETSTDLASLANALSYNILDVVFGEQQDQELMNLYMIQLTNKMLEYYKSESLLARAIKVCKKLTESIYPSFQLTWYKAIMYEVNQEIGDFHSKKLIDRAKIMLNTKEYNQLNDVLQKAISINPGCIEEVNALFS
ncbi:MAG: hypothetical protein COA79_15495 [Planctomycetota bacterium]|nr:MAG: hypothetical protein COA79_15495 [Planctomycetota bacterium]